MKVEFRCDYGVNSAKFITPCPHRRSYCNHPDIYIHVGSISCMRCDGYRGRMKKSNVIECRYKPRAWEIVAPPQAEGGEDER